MTLTEQLESTVTEFGILSKGLTFFEEFPEWMDRNLCVNVTQVGVKFQFMDDAGDRLFHAEFNLYLTTRLDEPIMKLNVPSTNFDPTDKQNEGEVKMMRMVNWVLDNWDEVHTWAFTTSKEMKAINDKALNLMKEILN